jgi:hypothetical protein
MSRNHNNLQRRISGIDISRAILKRRIAMHEILKSVGKSGTLKLPGTARDDKAVSPLVLPKVNEEQKKEPSVELGPKDPTAMAVGKLSKLLEDTNTKYIGNYHSRGGQGPLFFLRDSRGEIVTPSDSGGFLWLKPTSDGGYTVRGCDYQGRPVSREQIAKELKDKNAAIEAAADGDLCRTEPVALPLSPGLSGQCDKVFARLPERGEMLIQRQNDNHSIYIRRTDDGFMMSTQSWDAKKGLQSDTLYFRQRRDGSWEVGGTQTDYEKARGAKTGDIRGPQLTGLKDDADGKQCVIGIRLGWMATGPLEKAPKAP